MKNIKIDLETAEQLLADVRGYFDDLNDLEIEMRIPNIISVLSGEAVDKVVTIAWMGSPFHSYIVFSRDGKAIESGFETREDAELWADLEQGLEISDHEPK